MRSTLIILLGILAFPVLAQNVKAEFDKKHDLSQYKTFSLGGGEIITPEDQRDARTDKQLHQWMREAIIRELQDKGLQLTETGGDLLVTYVVGNQDRTDMSVLGPLGVTPDNNSQTWTRNYRMGSVIVDLNSLSGKLVWRVNATSSGNTSDYQQFIDQVMSAGFRKYSMKPKKR